MLSMMLSASNRCLEGVKWALQAAGASVGRLDCGAWFETTVYLRSGSTILRSFFFHWREIPSARALSRRMWWTAETASVCRKGCQKTLHVVFVSLHSLPFTSFHLAFHQRIGLVFTQPSIAMQLSPTRRARKAAAAGL